MGHVQICGSRGRVSARGYLARYMPFDVSICMIIMIEGLEEISSYLKGSSRTSVSAFGNGSSVTIYHLSKNCCDTDCCGLPGGKCHIE